MMPERDDIDPLPPISDELLCDARYGAEVRALLETARTHQRLLAERAGTRTPPDPELLPLKRLCDGGLEGREYSAAKRARLAGKLRTETWGGRIYAKLEWFLDWRESMRKRD